jgi:uncharacterized membrane protein
MSKFSFDPETWQKIKSLGGTLAPLFGVFKLIHRKYQELVRAIAQLQMDMLLLKQESANNTKTIDNQTQKIDQQGVTINTIYQEVHKMSKQERTALIDMLEQSREERRQYAEETREERRQFMEILDLKIDNKIDSKIAVILNQRRQRA